MSDIAISVKNVNKVYKLYNRSRDRLKEALGFGRWSNYRENYALNDVSFEVKKGESIGIIGTNGSGKSTILKIITGVLNPTSGSVEIDGRISALLELGAGFNMEYTGIENVYLNGTMIGFSKEEIDEKLPSILEFADIGDYVNQPVKTYSSGMFVRLAFAVAINIDPEILIVDEALSVGDVFFQAKCYHKFEEFKQQGKTILFVSHDLSSISKYCDRVVLLNRGIKMAEGGPQEMVDLYKKVLVGLDGQNNIDESRAKAKEISENQNTHRDALWKESFVINPNLNEYGNGKARIIDFAVIDENGLLSSTIRKGSEFTVRSKVKFDTDVPNPIFTMTLKTIKGQDITGTNTMLEKKDIGIAREGDVYVASFTQRMQLQGGEYLMSISCTGFENGEFTVHHRLYDVINLTVVSDKNTVGLYDMESEVKVEKV